MKRFRIITVGAAIFAVIVAVIVPMVLPESVGSQTNEHFVTQSIVTVTLSLFALLSAALFLLGLRDFKTEFKKTYYLICAGLVTQALALLIYPTAIYFDILGSSFTSYGGDLFYMIGAVMIFAGVSRFARLLGVAPWLRNLAVSVGVAAVGAVVLWAFPHSPVELSELYFDVTKGIISAEGILSLLSAMLIWRIRAEANQSYSRPLLWLAWALILNAGGEAFYYLANHLSEPDGTPHADLASVSGVVFLVSRILYIVAAYSLAFMTRRQESQQANAKPVDVIIGMAELASKPAEIDSMLDKLRRITATSAGKELTPEQLKTLRDLYYELEDYLINKEALLEFTSETLRRRLEHRFGTITFAPQRASSIK